MRQFIVELNVRPQKAHKIASLFSGICYRIQIEYGSSPDPGLGREVGNRVPEVMQNE